MCEKELVVNPVGDNILDMMEFKIRSKLECWTSRFVEICEEFC